MERDNERKVQENKGCCNPNMFTLTETSNYKQKSKKKKKKNIACSQG